MKPPKTTSSIAVFLRIWHCIKPYRARLVGALVLSVLLALMAPVRPLLIQYTLHHGIQSDTKGWVLTTPGAFIIEITLLQLFLLLIESTFRFIFSLSTAKLGQYVIRDLRKQTFNKVLQLNTRQFDKTPIGMFTTRTINDMEAINEMFSDGFIPILTDLMSILAVLIYMFATNWLVTLICLAPFPLLIFATYLFKHAVNKSFTRVRNAVAQLNSFVQEHLMGMSVIQLFSATSQEQKKFDAINKEHQNANIKAIFAYSIFFPFVELIAACSIGLLVWWVARSSYSYSPEEAGSLAGVITSFVLCLNLLFRPLRMIADKFNVLQMSLIAAERVFQVLDNSDVSIHTSEALPTTATRFKGEVQFDDVCFGYQKEVPVLRHINFHIMPGTTTAIVGATGSGKTSIINLLNRLYEQDTGLIRLDGKDIRDIPLENIRNNIAVVLQDPFLFSGSIYENITLFDASVSRETVIDACKQLGLHEFIMKLPGTYDFQVLEGGAALSTGQRQLVSFARAVVYNPTILMLDEATASVDPLSEQLIQQATESITHNRTSIIIAHRLSTIRMADTILVMNQGHLVEQGTHEELLRQDGYYAKQYRKQFSVPD